MYTGDIKPIFQTLSNSLITNINNLKTHKINMLKYPKYKSKYAEISENIKFSKYLD